MLPFHTASCYDKCEPILTTYFLNVLKRAHDSQSPTSPQTTSVPDTENALNKHLLNHAKQACSPDPLADEVGLRNGETAKDNSDSLLK